MKVLDKFFTWLEGHLGYRPATRVDHEYMDVIDFQKKFGHLSHPGRPVHLTKRKLRERFECMQEELQEFEEGMVSQDLPAMADALIDLVYFAKGTASMLGLPWEQLWDDVHSANMDKVPGVTKRGHKVDCIKPIDWIPPQTAIILVNAGYRRTEFTDQRGQVIENRCLDDQNV